MQAPRNLGRGAIAEPIESCPIERGGHRRPSSRSLESRSLGQSRRRSDGIAHSFEVGLRCGETPAGLCGIPPQLGYPGQLNLGERRRPLMPGQPLRAQRRLQERFRAR